MANGLTRWHDNGCPAPTLQELLDVLPKDMVKIGTGVRYYLVVSYEDDCIKYYNSFYDTEYIGVKIKDGNLTEAAAEMLLHLKEKGIWHIK